MYYTLNATTIKRQFQRKIRHNSPGLAALSPQNPTVAALISEDLADNRNDRLRRRLSGRAFGLYSSQPPLAKWYVRLLCGNALSLDLQTEVPFCATRVIACKLLIGKLLASFSRLYFGGRVYIASHDFAWQRKVNRL